MNHRTPDLLSAAFAALADPTRRAILARLALGETSVGELTQPFAISAPAVSRHLRVLERACLIERKTSAQWRICRLSPRGLRAANDWLGHYREFWEESLDRLVASLETPSGQTPAPSGPPQTEQQARIPVDKPRRRKPS